MADTYIQRVSSERDFTIIRNDVLQNPKLSFGARGFLAFLLSQPKSWKVPKIDDLTKYCPEGREKLYSYVRELMKAGHWHRFKMQFQDGNWGSICVVLEVANTSYNYSCWQSANPKAVEPKAVYPEAYKERKKKKQSSSNSTSRKPGRPPKATGEKVETPFPITSRFKLPPDFHAYAVGMGLEEHEIVSLHGSWVGFYTPLPNRMYHDGWLGKWKLSVNKYIQHGRRYRNLKNLDIGGSDEQQQSVVSRPGVSSASVARTEEIARRLAARRSALE